MGTASRKSREGTRPPLSRAYSPASLRPRSAPPFFFLPVSLLVGAHSGSGMADMADELVALFSNLNTSDRSELVGKFAVVMRTDESVSRFFLESSNWNVEQAVNTFLTTTRGLGSQDVDVLQQASRAAPEATLLTDLTPVQQTAFPPGATVRIVRHLLRAHSCV